MSVWPRDVSQPVSSFKFLGRKSVPQKAPNSSPAKDKCSHPGCAGFFSPRADQIPLTRQGMEQGPTSSRTPRWAERQAAPGAMGLDEHGLTRCAGSCLPGSWSPGRQSDLVSALPCHSTAAALDKALCPSLSLPIPEMRQLVSMGTRAEDDEGTATL